MGKLEGEKSLAGGKFNKINLPYNIEKDLIKLDLLKFDY